MRVELTYDKGIEVFDSRLNGDADCTRATLAMRRIGSQGDRDDYALAFRSRIMIGLYDRGGAVPAPAGVEDSGWQELAVVRGADIAAAGAGEPADWRDLLDLMGEVGVDVDDERWRLLRADVDGGNVWMAPALETAEVG